MIRVLLVALLVAAPPAAADWRTSAIHSEHGVRCEATGLRSVVCRSYGHTARLDAGQRARPVRSRTISRHGPLLLDGDAWSRDAYQCAAEWFAVICTDYATHGFRISPHSLAVW